MGCGRNRLAEGCNNVGGESFDGKGPVIDPPPPPGSHTPYPTRATLETPTTGGQRAAEMRWYLACECEQATFLEFCGKFLEFWKVFGKFQKFHKKIQKGSPPSLPSDAPPKKQWRTQTLGCTHNQISARHRARALPRD